MKRRPGIGKRGTIESNAKVFHAVQRTTMKLNLLESDRVYAYRATRLKAYAMEENVTILCDILMSNHSHTILYAEEAENILRLFHRVNNGLSQFVFDNVVKGSEYEKLFSDMNPYKLFSSSVRLFPIEGVVPLFIDTRYLYDNPKHHNSNTQGQFYTHSNFNQLLAGEMSKKDFTVFLNLYGMYPKQVMAMIKKNYQDFRSSLAALDAATDKDKEAKAFMVDPQRGWLGSPDAVFEASRSFDT